MSYIFLQIRLTSADVFVLEIPEHPEGDGAPRKSHDDDTDDGVHDAGCLPSVGQGVDVAITWNAILHYHY